MSVWGAAEGARKRPRDAGSLDPAPTVHVCEHGGHRSTNGGPHSTRRQASLGPEPQQPPRGASLFSLFLNTLSHSRTEVHIKPVNGPTPCLSPGTEVERGVGGLRSCCSATNRLLPRRGRPACGSAAPSRPGSRTPGRHSSRTSAGC